MLQNEKVGFNPKNQTPFEVPPPPNPRVSHTHPSLKPVKAKLIWEGETHYLITAEKGGLIRVLDGAPGCFLGEKKSVATLQPVATWLQTLPMNTFSW